MVRRQCPGCGSDEPMLLGDLKAEQVVSGNGTYHPDALARLGIAPHHTFSFGRCRRCGLTYALQLPSDAFLTSLYNDVIDGERARVESQSPAWTAHQLRLGVLVLERFAEAETVHVLDYGCGYGAILRALRGSRISCFGFEPSETVTTALREEGLDVARTIEEVLARAPFDAVILSDVLEHVPDPIAVLRQCHAMLAEGGWICVNVPDFRDTRSDAIFRALAGGELLTRELNPWEHLNYFSPATLFKVLEAAGFRPEPGLTADFGFRAGERGSRLWGNAAKSAARMAKFAANPQPTTTTAMARKSP